MSGVAVYLRNKNRIAIASQDANLNSKGRFVSSGLNVGKQLTGSLGVEFDPYYRHRAIRKSAEFVPNTTKTKTDSEKFNE
ncbi:hypothetical protein FXJ36_000692 [Neisseria gonorrhoeae]|uniref:hypothetical protein n=1 Tax=Neisseria gonorrhoeae TaxID=485 RepID=UPI000E56826E|nr:hypothetical protein [Neisseria gonorrhoeae]MDO6400754.1 hypothetical protein [Neisseria gonorrhoeae]ROU57365.1 hypothetical protein EGO73_07310 [Neisseria gonorrhoeae]